MTSRFHRYAELFKSKGPWCTVYTDISAGTVDSLHAIDVLPENICRELERQGASKADLAAVEAAVRPAEGVPEAFWHIGIRIEDDAVVTESGCELLTRGVPVAVDEIEALMRA